MKVNIIKSIWQYEVLKNYGEGLKGYGYTCIIYKDNIEVSRAGSFGGISQAEIYVRDYFSAKKSPSSHLFCML